MFKTFVSSLAFACLVNSIQLQHEEGEIKENNVQGSRFRQCVEVQRSTDIGVCLGKEVLSKLNEFNEADSFSLANGVEFVRDEKTPRDFANFLDKDPMDFRAMIEDTSQLITKRSLQWDLSVVYPGLTMRIGPTLANGILEFVMDPKLKDRTYHQYQHGEMSTGRLLARNLLVPFLLGFKFQLSTLLPLLLGLILIASKKAFLLAKVALIAATVFGFGGGGSSFGTASQISEFSNPILSPYTSFNSPSIFHGHGSSPAWHQPHKPYHHHSGEFMYREKSAEASTAQPITPDELRNRLERLFVTKQDIEDPTKKRNARHYAWTPINTG